MNSSSSDEMPIDERKSIILKTVIDAYIGAPTPVASRVVEQKSGLDVSAATIRNEMHLLEEAGYLTHTHTSSGRIPTDKGYRHFVDNYISQLRRGTRKDVIDFPGGIGPAQTHLEGLLDQTVHTLSSMTSHTAVLIKDELQRATISDVHCSLLGDNRIVVAFILDDSSLERIVVDGNKLSESDIDSNVLASVTADLKAHVVGKTFDEVTQLSSPEARSVSDEIIGAVFQSVDDLSGMARADARVHLSGVSLIASRYSSETESLVQREEITARLLSLLEQHMVLVELIRESVDDSISARIGTENVIDEMSQHSMVLAPFSTAQGETGAVGIIGPTRMDYKKVFAHLDAASVQLRDVLEQA